MVHESKRCGLFEVVEDVAWNNVIVRFITTGFTTRVRRCRLKDKAIFDPLFPSIYGLGFQGVGPWGQYTHKKEYSKWYQMMTRCYSPKYHKRKPTYIGCTVDKRWHCFQSFCEDLHKLPGYDLFLSDSVCHLDKDLLMKNNKQYGPETCQFIKPELNVKGLHYKTLNKEVNCG